MADKKETITAIMSRWAAGVRFEDLSQDAVYQAKRFLLDSIGCALGGYQQHDVVIALEVLGDWTAGSGDGFRCAARVDRHDQRAAKPSQQHEQDDSDHGCLIRASCACVVGRVGRRPAKPFSTSDAGGASMVTSLANRRQTCVTS